MFGLAMNPGGRASFSLGRTAFLLDTGPATVADMGEVIMFPASRRTGSAAESGSRLASPPGRKRASAQPEPLWRDVVGEELRAARANRGERIADVAGRAGMSPQYLSEIERGRKDPSSEMLVAVAGALGLTARELARRIATRYDVIAVTPEAPSRPSAPTPGPSEPLCLAA